MAKVIKVKPGEDLSVGNIDRVILELENGATKKSACEMLGIAYNTKRLQTIIDNHTQRMQFEKSQRAKRRGTAVLAPEACSMIEQYLSEGSMESVAKSHYRSTAIVKETLKKHGALLRSVTTDYFNPMMFPDECLAFSLDVGQLVWSSRYNCAAEVMKDLGGGAYKIWLFGNNGQYAFQPLEELGSLRHLEKLGVDITRIIKE